MDAVRRTAIGASSLHTDYRQPLHAYADALHAALGLH